MEELKESQPTTEKTALLSPTKPSPFLGAIKHTRNWLTSKGRDKIFLNVNFKSDTQRKIVIYCVHGTADREGCFNPFVENIQSRLGPHVYAIKNVAFKKRGTGRSIPEFAAQLNQKINESGDKDIILMGHSRGGLVITYFAEHLADKDKINIHLITTICAPFKGSYLAVPPITFFSKSVREMKPNSEFLKSLSATVADSSYKYYFFGATKDKVVLRDSFLPDLSRNQDDKESDQIERDFNANVRILSHIFLDGHGHLSSVSDSLIANRIYSELQDLSDSELEVEPIQQTTRQELDI